jgi:amino acid permease
LLSKWSLLILNISKEINRELLKNRWMAFVFTPPFLFFAWLTYLNMVHVSSYLFLFLAIFFGFMASYLFWGPQSSASTTFRRSTEVCGTFEGLISEVEILLRTTNATQNIKWPVWKKVVRNQNTILRFQSNNFFNFFPQSFFASDEDWQNFNNILDLKISSGSLKK